MTALRLALDVRILDTLGNERVGVGRCGANAGGASG
jgi:hypothetical protein